MQRTRSLWDRWSHKFRSLFCLVLARLRHVFNVSSLSLSLSLSLSPSLRTDKQELVLTSELLQWVRGLAPIDCPFVHFAKVCTPMAQHRCHCRGTVNTAGTRNCFAVCVTAQLQCRRWWKVWSLHWGGPGCSEKNLFECHFVHRLRHGTAPALLQTETNGRSQ